MSAHLRAISRTCWAPVCSFFLLGYVRCLLGGESRYPLYLEQDQEAIHHTSPATKPAIAKCRASSFWEKGCVRTCLLFVFWQKCKVCTNALHFPKVKQVNLAGCLFFMQSDPLSEEKICTSVFIQLLSFNPSCTSGNCFWCFVFRLIYVQCLCVTALHFSVTSCRARVEKTAWNWVFRGVWGQPFGAQGLPAHVPTHYFKHCLMWDYRLCFSTSLLPVMCKWKYFTLFTFSESFFLCSQYILETMF